MSVKVTLQQVQDARRARDPECVAMLCRLLTQADDPQQPPPREGVYDFASFLAETNTPAFRRKPPAEQAEYRIAKLALLESDEAEVPIDDRLRAHQVLWELWQADDAFSRRCLLGAIRDVPLVYGPFKALKRIFKDAEAADDTEVLGALSARFDMALDAGQHAVSKRTLAYLCRRGWRYLRRVGQTLPGVYPDVATDFLVHYQGYGDFSHSWILNHIFFHETGKYTAKKFTFRWDRPRSWQTHRAFPDAWKRSPRPLFALLERAAAERILEYAAKALKTDFRAAIREVDPQWVARLLGSQSETRDAFGVWILDNVPRFEQAKFRELGLHEAVLQLFDSPSNDARKYAAAYARTHARDLNVAALIRLANNDNAEVRKLAVDLLTSRDPRKDVGLDAWGQLLDTRHGAKLAGDMLRKHFGARELTPDWFAQRLLSAPGPAFDFACQQLTTIIPLKKLGVAFFVALSDRMLPQSQAGRYAAAFVIEQLEHLGPATIPPADLQRLLIHPLFSDAVCRWVENGQLKASVLGADFLKRMAFHPDWESDNWIAEQKATQWGKYLTFDEELSQQILDWLADVREFSPTDLGFPWLMQLVQRAEPRYHDFAVQQTTKAFLPADFAPSDAAAEADTAAESDQPGEAETEQAEINVDLEGASFVFTGKLKTMTRGEAQGKVTAAGGANSSTVGKKLDYLVIGDEGSPLYGEGRKGSKQVKAEKLNDDGAGIRIISETAFLQMLAGEQREFSEDAVQAGCEYLWSLMVDAENPDAPLARFARTYIRHHHPLICLAETDRPVDPGAEMPEDFLTFDRFLPLFSDSRAPLRELALEFASYEFKRWSPPIDGLVRMCDSPYPQVREFVAKTLTCDDAPEHRRYRVDPDVLTADAVYSFCESKNRQTRALGMRLIDMHPRLRLPEELFRLTESPDRQVRAFVIRAFWSLYRHRGIKPDWKPTPPPERLTKKPKKSQKATPIEERIGSGAPQRPEHPPADDAQLQELLRRMLFEVPPGRPPKEEPSAADEIVKLKPLSARKSKLNLIETMRDLAIEDAAFAQRVLPLFQEFKHSRGKSEQAACLVAITRITQ
ncbi:BRCT domain-containing protein [Roseimaritima ulvae]|uniref:DNA polymerase III subunit epsilon n=1 Tax=Roseimaritima ulvae TaxID=980254 RepID=A0A5B9QRB8_9BACT|nr:BRCT domain-containing protein [Roseimaritima ulvae]QEG40492.1 DNA polymerase III subunit epsilon [Roseimaritima ulvae]